MPPSEQQQDGIIDEEGTRIEDTNSPSLNPSSHKATPQAGAISLLLCTLPIAPGSA